MGPLDSDARTIGIVGAGHSGTTIVYRMLALHPDVAWLSQYSHRALMGPFGVRSAAAFADRFLRRTFRHDWTKARSALLWRRIVPTPIEAARIWDALLADLDPASQANRVRRAVRTACRISGRSTLLVKPPGRYRSRCAPLLSSEFPSSRFLHVARDGRAVAMSVIHKWQRAGSPNPEALLRRGATHWQRALAQVREYEQTLPVAFIRYEALCADVHGQLRRALEFVGLDPERFPFDVCPKTLRSTNESRLARAHPADLALLEELMADDLRRYGYA